MPSELPDIDITKIANVADPKIFIFVIDEIKAVPGFARNYHRNPNADKPHLRLKRFSCLLCKKISIKVLTGLYDYHFVSSPFVSLDSK